MVSNALHHQSHFITSMKWLQKDKALAEKIQTDPKVNCIKVKPYYREAFQCMVKSGEEASTKNGLAERWEGFQPQFEKRLDAWKQCQVPLYVVTIFWLTSSFPYVDWINSLTFIDVFECFLVVTWKRWAMGTAFSTNIWIRLPTALISTNFCTIWIRLWESAYRLKPLKQTEQNDFGNERYEWALEKIIKNLEK